jgi:flavin-dependent dehydrogenase
MTDSACDVLVIGGGPAGATAAYILAKANRRVIVVEKSTFPRFHIGESILPRAFPLIQELGLEKAFRSIAHVPKYGAEFAMGDDFNTTRFTFDSGFLPGSQTFNVERAVFDKMLLDQARSAGTEVRENTSVRQINRLADGDCQVTLHDGQKISSQYVFDASGQGCIVGRHLGIRKSVADPDLHKVAYFEHFKNVERRTGKEEGHPAIIMTSEGWFWLIAINAELTSVGFVCSPDLHKTITVAPAHLLAWAIERCPVVRDRMRNAMGPEENQVSADFSYTCKPYAGAGYFLIGDAACFLDPIFSTGVTLAMMSAKIAAEQVQGILSNQRSPLAARRRYIRFLEGSTNIFWHLIRSFYTHSFREMFLEGQGPLKVHGAVISILAGQIFPRPLWCLQWRLWLFNGVMWINRFVPLLPRRQRFSLLNQEPIRIMQPVA